MATNLHALIRYRTINKCLRDKDRNYNWKALAEACTEALLSAELSASLKEKKKDFLISRRTIFKSAQAYGELLVVRAQLVPEDSWAASEIDRCLSLDSSSSDQIAGVHEGIALMSGFAVLNGKLAQTAVQWLGRLKTSCLPGVTEGIFEVFPLQDSVAYGDDLAALLQLLTDQPHHLQRSDLKGLLDALRGYAPFAPELVLAIAKHLVEQNVARKREGTSAAARYVSELVEIAIQLQEIDGFSEAGLDLFDQLQTLNHPDVENVLDGRGQHGVRPFPRVNRRR